MGVDAKEQGRWVFSRLWMVFFFHGMAPGFWVPTLTNVLKAQGHESWVALVFGVPPVCSLIAPLVGGGLADEKLSAQKLMGWSSVVAALAIVFAFVGLQRGYGAVWFMSGIALYSLASGPSWGLLATVSLTHLENGERQYPLVRLGATFGWMGAGYLISYVMKADTSVIAGYCAAVARLVAGYLSFGLPNTPPMGGGRSWKSALGLGGFGLFRNRNHAVMFVVTGMFSVPLIAFYMYVPEMFSALGDKSPTASTSVAQWSEVFAMIFLGTLMVRYRMKTLLMWGLGLSVLRFAMSGYAGFSGLIGWHFAGVALHGVCYTIYFVTAQVYLDRRVEAGMRGQAQGLLGLMASGIGPLVGAIVCGWLRAVCVDDEGRGWDTFWWILAGMIGICWVSLGVLYQSVREDE